MRSGLEDRALGALLGLAVGDAVGTTLEFQPRDSYEPLTDMIGGSPFRLEPGQWTDDTAMALALAESLIACGGVNERDLMERFSAWRRRGDYSCTGVCFDIGHTTSAGLLIMAMNGESRDAVLAPQAIEAEPAIAAILAGSWRGKARHEIHSSGYVAHSLEAALWAVGETGTFRDAVLLAANLGDDADTTAAITGQLAGALYGQSGIPAEWLDKLAWRERIEALGWVLLQPTASRSAPVRA